MAALTRGNYMIVIRNLDLQAISSFSLDVVRTLEMNRKELVWNQEHYSAIQFCPAVSEPNSLNHVGYIHPLSGNSKQNYFGLKMITLDSGFKIPVTLTQDSLIIAYIETP